MRTIDTNIITQLASGAYTAVLAVELTVGATTYRYVSHETPLLIGAVRYESRDLSLGPAGFSESVIVDSASLGIDNRDGALTTACITNEIHGAAMKALLGVLGASGLFLVLPLFEGTVDEFSLDDAEIRLSISSPMSPWDEEYLSRHSPSCRWKEFKGTECKYAGDEPICDRTYERCLSLGNTDNFGGFRWLPSIENKTIWWGRKASLAGGGV